MKKLIVLDYRTERVDVYPYDTYIWDNAEDFTDKDGNFVIHNDCNWMIVDELLIKNH